MFAADVCDLPTTGGSAFVLVAGLFVLVAGVIVARWVRQSAGRLSVVVAPLVLLGGLALVPATFDPCATTTTVAPVVYGVGDTGPGGGIVFYVDLTREPGAQYFEAACAGWQNNCDGTTADPQAEWGCYGTPISGADGTAIGTGELNTTNILAGCLTVGIAADLADDYSHNSLDDWFLPSKHELNQMYTNLHSASTPLGGFLTAGYWSSSEFDVTTAWYQDFGFGFYAGYQLDVPKDFALWVRPVRAF